VSLEGANKDKMTSSIKKFIDSSESSHREKKNINRLALLSQLKQKKEQMTQKYTSSDKSNNVNINKNQPFINKQIHNYTEDNCSKRDDFASRDDVYSNNPTTP